MHVLKEAIDPTPHLHGTCREYRVLLVDLSWTFGGVETRILSQAAALRESVAQCAVAALEGSPLHERTKAEGIACLPIRGSSVRDPRLALILASLIRNGGYDIVDAHGPPAILWGHLGASLGGARGRVATIHGDYRHEHPGLQGLLHEAVLWLDRRLARQFVTIVEMLQSKAIEQGIGARTSLIHNTVPLPPTPLGDKDPALLKEWGFAASDFVVGNIASLTPRKGQRHLLDAIARLSDLKHIKLVLVGDGPLRARLEKQSAELGISGRVHFAGFQPDVANILRSIDCFCLPSFMEGLPYSMLEAAACARPLVVSAVGGMTDVLEHGKEGLLTPPKDTKALAACLRQLATDPDLARRIGLAAYALVRRSFSNTTEMIEQTLRVYERALAP